MTATTRVAVHYTQVSISQDPSASKLYSSTGLDIYHSLCKAGVNSCGGDFKECSTIINYKLLESGEASCYPCSTGKAMPSLSVSVRLSVCWPKNIDQVAKVFTNMIFNESNQNNDTQTFPSLIQVQMLLLLESFIQHGLGKRGYVPGHKQISKFGEGWVLKAHAWDHDHICVLCKTI